MLYKVLFHSVFHLLVISNYAQENITKQNTEKRQPSQIRYPSSTQVIAQRITQKKKLRILGFLEFHSSDDPFMFDSAVTVAEKLIDESDNILPDYDLEIIRKEPGNRIALPVYYLHNETENGRINGVLGPGKSAAVELISDICSKYGILQMSYTAQDTILRSISNKTRYLFSGNPSLDAFSNAIAALFKANNIKRTAILYSITDPIFIQTTLQIQKLLAELDIEIVVFEKIDQERIFNEISLSEDSSQKHQGRHYQQLVRSISEIKENDVRVIIGIFRQDFAGHIFCEAYKANLYGNKYLWITPDGNTMKDWPDTGNLNDMNNCSSSDLKEAARGYMQFRNGAKRIDGVMTVANKTADEILKMIFEQRERRCERSKKKTCAKHLNGLFAFDVLWALALTLDKAEKEIKGFSIDQMEYNDFSTTNRLAKILDDLEFEGVSGFYSYRKNNGDIRERIPLLILTQYSNDSTLNTDDSLRKNYGTVGEYNGRTNKVRINTTYQQLVLPGYRIPLDGPIRKFPAKTFHIATIIFTWVVSFAGIILALMFLYFNIRNRKHMLIKLSSPNINNLIIIGCVCCYLSIILYGIDSRLTEPSLIPSICNATTVLLLIGFTLTFGSLFSKTWRIYRIFTIEPSLQPRGITDFHLIIVVFLMLVVDILIICFWMTLSPYEIYTQYLTPESNLEEDTITTPVIYRCNCKYNLHFTVTTYAYKGLIMLFGVFVAWETKKIKVTVLNDSKYIGMSAYVVALFSSIVAVVTHSLEKTTSFEAAYIIFAVCIASCTTVTLCLLFVPKVRLLMQNYEDPNFKNGRPVLDDEFNGTSSVYPSMSECESSRTESILKVRAGTTCTTESGIISSSLENKETISAFDNQNNDNEKQLNNAMLKSKNLIDDTKQGNGQISYIDNLNIENKNTKNLESQSLNSNQKIFVHMNYNNRKNEIYYSKSGNYPPFSYSSSSSGDMTNYAGSFLNDGYENEALTYS